MNMVYYLKICQYLQEFPCYLLSLLMNLTFWGEGHKFARVVFTGTAKFEMVHMRNNSLNNYLIFVGPLQDDVFDKLLQMITPLNNPEIKELVKKVTNGVPRELMILAQ